MTRVTGCESTAMLPPLGSIKVGAVMFTPAMGPATDGLSGLLLLAVWQAAANADAAIRAAPARMFTR